MLDVACLRVLPKLRQLSSRLDELLRDWNCTFEAESSAAALYEVTFAELQILLKRRLNVSEHPFEGTAYFSEYTYRFVMEEDAAELVSEALTRAEEALDRKFGKGEWQWGELHLDRAAGRVLSQLPIANRWWGLQRAGRGNMNTLDYARMLHTSRGDFRTSIRATMRFLYSFGE